MGRAALFPGTGRVAVFTSSISTWVQSPQRSSPLAVLSLLHPLLLSASGSQLVLARLGLLQPVLHQSPLPPQPASPPSGWSTQLVPPWPWVYGVHLACQAAPRHASPPPRPWFPVSDVVLFHPLPSLALVLLPRRVLLSRIASASPSPFSRQRSDIARTAAEWLGCGSLGLTLSLD